LSSNTEEELRKDENIGQEEKLNGRRKVTERRKRKQRGRRETDEGREMNSRREEKLILSSLSVPPPLIFETFERHSTCLNHFNSIWYSWIT
jgi:hypothetical protein